MRTKRIILTILAIAIILGIGYIWYAIDSAKKIEFGQGVATVSWLPDEATDVSYYKSYGWTAYEFTISESGFRKWASKYPLQEIDETLHMERWSWVNFSRESSGLSTNEYHTSMLDHLTSIEEGLLGGASWDNGGRELMAFDRAAGRAYFQFNPR